MPFTLQLIPETGEKITIRVNNSDKLLISGNTVILKNNDTLPITIAKFNNEDSMWYGYNNKYKEILF